MENRKFTINRTLRKLKRRQIRTFAPQPSDTSEAGSIRSARRQRNSGQSGSVLLPAMVRQRTRQLTEANNLLQSIVVRSQRLDGGLQASKELFRSIFEHAAAGMNTITLEGRYLQVNPAFCRFIGYRPEELRHLTLFDLTHPDDLPATCKQFEALRAGNCEAFDYEKRFIRKDGKPVWGHVTSAWVFDDLRQPLYGIGLVQDISGLKRSEADLQGALHSAREAQARIACILESVGDGLVVTDPCRRVILMNPRAEALLGVSQSQVAGKVVTDPALSGLLPDSLIGFLDGRKEADQFELKLAAGLHNQPLVLQARRSSIRDSCQSYAGTITILRDISREREIDAMKTEFITTAAHELRTPLTSIQGFSEVLLTRSDLDKGECRSMLSIIHEQAENLGRIVNDLLDLSRIESGTGFVLGKTPCDLTPLLKQIAAQFSLTSDCHRFELVLETDPLIVLGDRGKLIQALENILGNAVKYSPGGGPIRIAAQIREGDVCVSVSDQGIGMTEVQRQRIFDKFYRADTSNSAIEGTGLGMNIVQEILKAHGGKVWVESIIGEGTVVTFFLPLHAPDA